MTFPTDSRSHARLPADDRCRLEFDRQVVHGQIADLSLSGVYVRTERIPELGTEVGFEAENMKGIKGIVVRCTADGFALRFEPEEAKAVGIGDLLTFVVNRELLSS